MHALGLKPRSGAKIPASIQDQQASGFLLEGTLEQHVPSFQKGGEATEFSNTAWYFSNTLLPSTLFPQYPPPWLLPVCLDKQQVLLSLEKLESILCRASFWPDRPTKRELPFTSGCSEGQKAGMDEAGYLWPGCAG